MTGSEKIIEHYGIRPQAKYMCTEVYELIEAIFEAEQFSPNALVAAARKAHVKEEIADVWVFLDQFCKWYGIKWDDVYKVAGQKIDRQLSRIETSVKK